MQPWTVPQEWSGETAFILGGGPSLLGFDAAVLEGRRIIAINRSYRLAPSADVLYFCDRSFWQHEGLHIKLEFRGRYIASICEPMGDPDVRHLRNTGHFGLERRRDGLKHGSNSGYQAIGLARHFGATRIVLLGYDMQLDAGRTHFHEGYGKDPDLVHHVLTRTFLPQFANLVGPLQEEGIEVINANPNSALECWPRMTFAEALDLVG
jgi:hypothetical protein